ncbi:MAG: NYN domain-containing protein [Parcubacteria group bacterium]|nr:NYN domain-containing protein [Parcubacteria group bacterium]
MENEYLIKLKSALKEKVAIYIDAANLEQSVRDMWVNPKDIPNELKHIPANKLRWSVDYKKLKIFFKSVGVLVFIRFYSADFESKSHFNFRYFLRKNLKFLLNTKPLKRYYDHTDINPHRKANFDVEIATDATFNMSKYDTFILFSGDCDFEYLLKFLRGHGKLTVVFSRSGHVAKELPPACHQYFDITDFRSEILQITPKAKNPIPNGMGPRS